MQGVLLGLLSSAAYANSSAGGGAFSFARARLWLGCRATGESVLDEFLCFGVIAALILARLQGHWGERFGGVFLDGFWQCRICITTMGSKV